VTVLQTSLKGAADTGCQVRALDITVLAGGVGTEREVSLESGKAVHGALTRLGHRTTLSDIRPDNLAALDVPADFVFIALHGEFGEDGAVQSLLDQRKLAYCGSGAEASRTAMDKVASKRLFEAANIPTPAYEVVTPTSIGGLTARIAVPAVVKPVASGSSVDTVIARTSEGLVEAARRVADKYGRALVERYIRGPELTCGVLGDIALPVCEIRPSGEFYDYHAKYVADDTQYLFELDLPQLLLQRVQRLSLEAHRVLRCRGFSRVDWMVDERTLEPYALEVNTIPGFTSHSLLPKAASRIGLSFDDLCQRIVELSLNRADQRTKVEGYGTKE